MSYHRPPWDPVLDVTLVFTEYCTHREGAQLMISKLLVLQILAMSTNERGNSCMQMEWLSRSRSSSSETAPTSGSAQPLTDLSTASRAPSRTSPIRWRL